jgi:hypothetical protein
VSWADRGRRPELDTHPVGSGPVAARPEGRAVDVEVGDEHIAEGAHALLAEYQPVGLGGRVVVLGLAVSGAGIGVDVRVGRGPG